LTIQFQVDTFHFISLLHSIVIYFSSCFPALYFAISLEQLLPFQSYIGPITKNKSETLPLRWKILSKELSLMNNLPERTNICDNYNKKHYYFKIWWWWKITFCNMTDLLFCLVGSSPRIKILNASRSYRGVLP